MSNPDDFKGKPEKDAQEDRSGTRVKHRISVAYSLDVEDKPERKFISYLFGTLLDISQRGLCFKARDNFKTQKIISLFLKLSYEMSGIKMLGKILWLKPEKDGQTRVGIKFIGALPPDWKKLVPKTSEKNITPLPSEE